MASPSEWVLTVHPATDEAPCEACSLFLAAEASGDVTVDVVEFMVETITRRVVNDREVTLCERHAQPFTAWLVANGVQRLPD